MSEIIENAAVKSGMVRPRGAPLGPGSLIWELYGDWRMRLIGVRAGILENMLPELGQAVEDHSVFFDNPYRRAERSLPPILRTVYASDEVNEGHSVRDFHAELKGEMPDGSRYHALNPETYFWAHATFVEMIITATERFIRKLSDAQKEQVYAESITWYRRYGVSEHHMPTTYADFVEYWDYYLNERLVPHKTALFGVGYITKGLYRVPPPDGLSKRKWTIIARIFDTPAAFMSTGGLPERSREQLNLPWSVRQERRYRRFCRVMRALDPLIAKLPAKYRLHKIALDGYEKAGASPMASR